LPVSRIAYVDGRYVPTRSAAVHIEDRGYQFADGVYEVCAVVNGVILDEKPHLDRLDRSLRELEITAPMGHAALGIVMRRVIARNRIRNGIIYLQITRGVARRDHPFPAFARPVLVMTSKSVDFSRIIERALNGVTVITVPDLRWARRDIKSTSLLPNVLAKQAAVEKGAGEAWQVDETGHVTEGSATNAWIVPREGLLVTRPLDNDILAGVTRKGMMEVARELGYRIEERSFTVAEAKKAREAFFTSTTNFAMPVISIDGDPVGTGKAGPIVRAILSAYWRKVIRETGLSTADVPALKKL
jgi:D-alanine transaminase